MKQNKFVFEHGFHLATACALLALILFIPATMSKTPGLSIFFYVLSALLLIAGGVILFLAYKEKSRRLHYFLHDAPNKPPLPVGALNAERVRRGVDRYLAEYMSDLSALWQNIPKELRMRLEEDEAFCPLIAYRMFLELSEEEEGNITALFLGADDRAVGYLCRAIRDSGDKDMADFIYDLKKNTAHDAAHISSFFKKNHRCFEDRMVHYTKRHIDEFYI